MAKKKKSKGWLTEFLEQRNYYLAGVLILIIYGAVYFYIATDWAPQYADDPGPARDFIKNITHILPLLAIIMFVMGYLDRRQKRDDERERAQKRYQATLEISRLDRQARPAAPPSKPPAAKASAAPDPSQGEKK